MNPLDQPEPHIDARISTSLVAHCRCSTDLHPHTVGGRTIWRRVHDDRCPLAPPAGVTAPPDSNALELCPLENPPWADGGTR